MRQGREFQVKLFDRATLPIQPTEAGKQFYQDAKILLRQYERMKATLSQIGEDTGLRIRLCYTSQIDLKILLPFVRQFKKNHPEIAFEIMHSTFRDASQLLWIRRCDAAVGIDFEPAYTENLQTLVLYEGEYQALVPSSHPLYDHTSIAKEELYRYPLVMLSPDILGLSYQGMIDHATLDINGPELMTISDFVAYGNQATGNNVRYQEITDEENYQIFDAMGVPRTTDGVFKKDSEAPFSSDGMVTFAQAIREGKMDTFTDDFEKLTGEKPMTVLYMFEHADDFQIGERHSKDN